MFSMDFVFSHHIIFELKTVLLLFRYNLEASSVWAEKGYPFPKEALARADDLAILAEDKFRPANTKERNYHRLDYSQKYKPQKAPAGAELGTSNSGEW